MHNFYMGPSKKIYTYLDFDFSFLGVAIVLLDLSLSHVYKSKDTLKVEQIFFLWFLDVRIGLYASSACVVMRNILKCVFRMQEKGKYST